MSDARSGKIPVYLSRELYERVKKEIGTNQGGFMNVEEYVEYVLEELLRDEDPDKKYSKEDEEKIKRRLRDLGYIE